MTTGIARNTNAMDCFRGNVWNLFRTKIEKRVRELVVIRHVHIVKAEMYSYIADGEKYPTNTDMMDQLR